MSDLEGLTFDDWHMYHCDTDVQGTAIDALELLKHDEQTIESLQHTISKLTKAIAEKPEVVRCKDCKHGDIVDVYDKKMVSCRCDEDRVNPLEWYCPYGEVKQDGRIE